MNRRQALKNIGLGAGIIVVGPTTLSLLQSCKKDPKVTWEPIFLSAANGFALKQILEVILPATDTPGANELNIANFIDSYMDEVASEERRENFNRSASAFAAAFKDQFDKDLEKGDEEEYRQIVDKYLRATPEIREDYIRRNTETQDPMDKDPEENLDFEAGAYSYLTDVRGMGIWAWKTSEQIGENVLWYDPIPGEYIPCGPVSELGNGKAMSL
ncbi:gluconate 2-dehydrogenase subunit 3 family protein [Antarcticibacterium arcticum]|uniref:Gluconate 2-dehydrogenase subunit 3 family protein n=1 Tax=Antarcticibacterium arcticum TaxID=2585771 RepID=A0A5B8YJK3_9FLAO|nr:gluconate 2-dehydrogenase subunit 3 family protein [Antarcticibacterium arcticum]QED37288.1 gluconate 2-dehydrogenase subunit 3 family protein [Antarcticibacterium arcticum]